MFAAGWFMTIGLSRAVPVTDGLMIHLDAGSLTGLADGQTVTNWPDLATADAANGTLFAETGLGRPTYQSGVLNGLPVVRYVRSEQDVLVSQEWSFPNPSQGVTIFSVCTGGTSGLVERLLQVGAAAGTESKMIAADVAQSQSGCRYNNGYALSPAGSNPVSGGAFHISVRQMAQGGRHDSLYYAVNGSSPELLQANNGGNQIMFNADHNHLSLGNGKDPSAAWYPDYYGGDTAEVLVYNKQLSAAETGEVLLYLGQKYALAVQTHSIAVETAEGIDVQEGGASDVLTIRLLSDPQGYPVTVRLSDSLDPAQVTLSSGQLVFTSDNWQSGQSITVTAIDDGYMERAIHDTTLSLIVETNPASPYHGTAIADVWVNIEDNDCGSRGFNRVDYNLDCRVDLEDFVYFAEQWVECGTPDPECS